MVLDFRAGLGQTAHGLAHAAHSNDWNEVLTVW